MVGIAQHFAHVGERGRQKPGPRLGGEREPLFAVPHHESAVFAEPRKLPATMTRPIGGKTSKSTRPSSYGLGRQSMSKNRAEVLLGPFPARHAAPIGVDRDEHESGTSRRRAHARARAPHAPALETVHFAPQLRG